MRTAILISVVLTMALGIVACGHSDPFVGGWGWGADDPSSLVLVISKSGADYRATFWTPAQAPFSRTLQRHGDRITGTMPALSGSGEVFEEKLVFTYRGKVGELCYSQGEHFTDIPMYRVTESTVVPSPYASPGTP